MVTGAALALSGCATAPALLTAGRGETFPELEPLQAAHTDADGLVIRVTSRGCAARADFVFRVDRKGGRALVAFARRRLETCKGPTGSAELRFGYEELGLTRGEPVVIANPLLSPSA